MVTHIDRKLGPLTIAIWTEVLEYDGLTDVYYQIDIDGSDQSIAAGMIEGSLGWPEALCLKYAAEQVDSVVRTLRRLDLIPAND